MTRLRRGRCGGETHLEGIHVAQAVLHVAVHDEFGQAEDLAAEMEGIAEPRLLSLFGGQGLDRLQVEVEVQVQIVEVLAVDEQVEHVVALTADLQPRLHPVELRRLEELGGLEGAEQIALLLGLRGSVFQCIQHIAFEQLLVRHSHLDRHAGWTMLAVPGKEKSPE